MALYVDFFKQSLFNWQRNARINFVGLLCKVKLQGLANFYDEVYLNAIQMEDNFCGRSVLHSNHYH